jgi:hypothetical protein
MAFMAFMAGPPAAEPAFRAWLATSARPGFKSR